MKASINSPIGSEQPVIDPLETDTINEKTPAAGVTIDGCLIKDGKAGTNTCRIKTGTYTGDGSLSQAITGVGFRPISLYIWPHPVAEGATNLDSKMDRFGIYSIVETPAFFSFFDNRANSLDADGFTVDDDNLDVHPNKNAQVYDYSVLG